MSKRNCRCCLASYEKPTNKWCEIPEFNKETGEIEKPVGFCEFCDRKNDKWYVDDEELHKKHQEKTKAMLERGKVFIPTNETNAEDRTHR